MAQPTAQHPGLTPVYTPNHVAPQHYVVFDPRQQQHPSMRPRRKVEYSKDSRTTVKWLSITQLTLAIAILVLQCVTTAMYDHFYNLLGELKDKIEYDYLFYDEFADRAATGIWLGIIMTVTAACGIAAYKTQRKGLIVTHLVLNLFSLICLLALIGTAAATVGTLNSCRSHGESYYTSRRYDYYDWNNPRRSTTTMKPEKFFGETIRSSGNFFCKAHFFKIWLAFDCILLVCAVLQLIFTFTVFIYNCVAACAACCCSCCCPGSGYQDNHTVAYYGHPQMQVAPQPITSQHFTPQQFVPTSGFQPVPMYGYQAPAPIMTTQSTPTAMGGSGAQAAGVPAVTTQPAANTQGQDSKWEELPPEYSYE